MTHYTRDRHHNPCVGCRLPWFKSISSYRDR